MVSRPEGEIEGVDMARDKAGENGESTTLHDVLLDGGTAQ